MTETPSEQNTPLSAALEAVAEAFEAWRGGAVLQATACGTFATAFRMYAERAAELEAAEHRLTRLVQQALAAAGPNVVILPVRRPVAPAPEGGAA